MAEPPRRSRRRDPAADFEDAVARLADLVRAAKHVVVCTGAGISTNAGIRDYRGPDGIWTEAQQQGIVSGEPGDKRSKMVDTPWDQAMYRLLPAAKPTLAHRALTLLATQAHASDGTPLVKHVISQNEDGLHLRSGLPPEHLSEVHGNAFIELCGDYQEDDSDSDLGSSSSSSSSEDDDDDSSSSGSSISSAEVERIKAAATAAKKEAQRLRPPGCGAAVVRDFVTYHGETYRRDNAAGRHVTRRSCPHCRPVAPAPRGDTAGSSAGISGASADGPSDTNHGPLEGVGWLHDTTVDFGECPGGFPWGHNSVHNMQVAKHHMQLADLVLVMGSSLSILANYFCPWRPESKWAKPPPEGLRLAPPPEAAASSSRAGGGAKGADAQSGSAAERDGAGSKRKGKAARTSKCRLVIVNRGPTLDEELAALKIEVDVDRVCEELLRQLGLPSPPPYCTDADPLRRRVVQPHDGEPSAEWRF